MSCLLYFSLVVYLKLKFVRLVKLSKPRDVKFLYLTMRIFVTLFLLLLMLIYSSSSGLLVLFFISFLMLPYLCLNYSFVTFSSYSLDSLMFLSDEYGITLIFIILFVIFYSFTTHLASSNTESFHKTYFLL